MMKQSEPVAHVPVKVIVKAGRRWKFWRRTVFTALDELPVHVTAYGHENGTVSVSHDLKQQLSLFVLGVADEIEHA